MDPLRILTVARTLPHQIQGGMEESAWNLARALSRAGAQVTVLTSSLDHEDRRWTRDGVDVHEIAYVPRRLRSKPQHRWWRHFGAAAARYAKREGLLDETDVVHAHSSYGGSFLGLRPRPPVVASIHGTAWGDYVRGSRERLRREVGAFHPRRLLQLAAVLFDEARMRRQLSRLDAVVAVGPLLVEQLGGIGEDDPRLRVISNGVDPDAFPAIDRRRAREELGLPLEDPIVLYLGRLEAYKGVLALHEAVAGQPPAHLVLAGEGTLLEELQRRVRLHPGASRIHVVGRVDASERARLYAAADLFCLPSAQEGQPVTLLESLAMGTPVATTRPWLPQTLHPFAVFGGDVGRLVRDGLALSRAVRPEETRNTVLGGFTWDHVAEEYLTLFRALVEARTPGPSVSAGAA